MRVFANWSYLYSTHEIVVEYVQVEGCENRGGLGVQIIPEPSRSHNPVIRRPDALR